MIAGIGKKSFIMKTLLLTVTAVFICIFFIIPPSLSTENEGNKNDNGTYWNDLSKFLAGVKVAESSKFWKVSQSNAYKYHIKYMDKFWKKVEDKAISRITPWRKANLNTKSGEKVFYPLSGADFIYMYTLFPEDSDYLMVALESQGNIQRLSKLSPAQLHSGLASVRRLIYHYGLYNYFQSRIMKKEMCNFSLSGTTPVIMIFMARMGIDIINVERIGIDNSGRIAQRDGKGLINGKSPKSTGSRIYFKDTGSSKQKTLVYLNMKLSKENLSLKRETGLFLNNLSGLKTMMKSAVYLCHFTNFKTVSDFILEKSVMIVQDDSGIPFNAFNNKLWTIRLYGVYYPYFKLEGTTVRKQKDLLKLYKDKSSPLPFMFGYGGIFGKNKSNLMIAEKKNTEKAEL